MWDLSVSASSPLMSVFVYISQLLVDDSDAMDDSLSLGMVRCGRFFLIQFSMSASCDEQFLVDFVVDVVSASG